MIDAENAMPFDGDQIDNVSIADQQSAFLLGDAFDRIQHAYKIMNWFASGESQNQWSRALPQDVLGEVYFVLAPLYEQLKLLNNPQATKRAQNWYQKKLDEEMARHKEEELRIVRVQQHRADMRILEVQQQMVEMRERCDAEIKEAKAKIGASIRKAVEKAIKKTEDRLKGRQRTLGSSGRQVRL
ncbi:hypothetical protein EVC24_037 [Rhizobium phage RHph_I4]|nr:hypothetical protein EVC24_037 [Rhizobium phage RHph_I4]